MEQTIHAPVLFHESLDALSIKSAGCYLDATFGRGGHSRGILERLGSEGRLIALDRDPQAAKAAAELTGDHRFHFIATAFSALDQALVENGFSGTFDGVLLDLGVSSPQLDQADRGFSFLREGPLDMRMDTRSGMTAEEWLCEAKEQEIARVLKELGEERFARRIARAIVAARETMALRTTTQLAELISSAIPTRERDKHPATRSFQAIRIHINRELEELQLALQQAMKRLAPGGRLAVISFHSLEDRMVKRFIRDQARGEVFPKGVPVIGEHHNAQLRVIGKKITAAATEVAANPRSRSAVLRVAERLA